MNKIAAIQMTSTPSVVENLSSAACLIEEASRNEAKLIVLPEMFAIIGLNSKDKLQAKEQFGNGPIQDFLRNQALKHKIWIIGGTIPIACSNNEKIRAASLVFNDTGNIVGRYDKIHLFDVSVSETETYKESEHTECGGKAVVIDSPFGKIGLAVCYDIRFPQLFSCLANRGAEIITIPSAFTMKTGQAHWEILLRSRAIENSCYIIGAAQGGLHVNGRRTYGHSMIIEPWGSILEKLGEDKPGIAYGEINHKHLQDVRKTLPILKHQKPITSALGC